MPEVNEPKSKEYTPKEKSDMQKSRILEDAEMLLNDGPSRGTAGFVEDAGANELRLEVPAWRLAQLTKRNERIDVLEKRIAQRDIKKGDTIKNVAEWKIDMVGTPHYREINKFYPDSTLRFDHFDRSGVLVFDEVRPDGSIVQTYNIDVDGLNDFDKVEEK